MSQTIDSFPPADEATANTYRERWHNLRYSCDPSDRKAAEAGIELAYESAGMKKPEHILWFRSPIEMQHSRLIDARRLEAGPSVKAKLVDQPLMAALAAVNKLPASTRNALARTFNFRASSATAFRAADQAIGELADAPPPWSSWRQRFAFYSRRLPAALNLDRDCWAPYDLRDGLGLCQFAHDALGCGEITKGLAGLWQVALSAGWVIPHERVCWLSDRWSKFACDADGHLHSSDGPAIEFRDRARAYFWKNVQVPGWAIEHPDRITERQISRERSPVVRRCLIEIMTPRRFIDAGIPHVRASDQSGVLWTKRWRNDIWAAVEVVDGTAQPDGSHARYVLQVPGHVGTALEAVAWTYGMSPGQYLNLSRRT